ncbi:GntR family transcriptional regulator [Maribrevibacterium harenarium]|uniref:GntR family transcriptional regulator n=1 Tax=Maribrevibacterium harenarium TaxID=2589817 RepID=A0A501X577_9GAMM|nr:GntR family transcriptional regulator [Maribrevibacterium harenarium]TPE55601.1 GntR family transcriptional regulator [Maribrevibacterium harenarium]
MNTAPTGDLYNTLKNDIVSGVLPRGLPLRQQDLSERYQVSRIPVRDAMMQLKAEGWLVPHGKAGVMIPKLNWLEAEDLYQMRALLEVQLLAYAIPGINHEVLGRARDINHQLNAPHLDLLGRGQLNWLFHATLYQCACRPALFRTVESLNDQVRRYMGFQYGPLGYQDTSQQEHDRLLTLLERKQQAEAMKLLQQHIEEAGILLVDYLQKLEQ